MLLQATPKLKKGRFVLRLPARSLALGPRLPLVGRGRGMTTTETTITDLVEEDDKKAAASPEW